jgi:hypothetical protein
MTNVSDNIFQFTVASASFNKDRCFNLICLISKWLEIKLSIYVLFNYAFSRSEYITSNVRITNELESKRKEAAVAWFKILHRHFPVESKENNQKPPTGSLRAEIWARGIPNTKQECYPFDHDIRWINPSIVARIY